MCKFESSEKKRLIIKELEKVGFTNYYLQIFDPNCKLERRIELLLKVVGMDPAILGHLYTKEAVKIIFEKEKTIKFSTIYAMIGNKYEVKRNASVERNIRHAKEKMFKTLKPEMKALLFGDMKVEKLENNVFIYSLSNFMKSFEV